jgi:ketosteroid isomerase-like protein
MCLFSVMAFRGGSKAEPLARSVVELGGDPVAGGLGETSQAEGLCHDWHLLLTHPCFVAPLLLRLSGGNPRSPRCGVRGSAPHRGCTSNAESLDRTSHYQLNPTPGSIMTRRQAVKAYALPAVVLSVLSMLGCAEEPVSEDEQAVIEVVERFLGAAGRYDLDSLPLLFTPDANIAATSRPDGEAVSTTFSFDEWLASLRARPNPRPYTEPVSHFTVHVDNGQLAFVRADATLMRDGEPQSHNIDYFTLIRHEGAWKILSGSYTTTPIH